MSVILIETEVRTSSLTLVPMRSLKNCECHGGASYFLIHERSCWLATGASGSLAYLRAAEANERTLLKMPLRRRSL